MAYWNFPGKTQAWLLAELDKLNDDKSAGKTVVASGAGDSNLTERTETSISARDNMLRQDLAALAAASLNTVPLDFTRPAKRVRPHYK
ncbi:MAG: hypothetical protein EB141_04965 [Verrucomicrobia bacterium]|nr:hypothetical protein [Pseudomonadota bacterium]NDA67854.1 hypothetical protein [Verrucomicrobiota bacterium]NDB74988.1 hypothetical protein [Verrucomicrobiota bacterium]NDD39636.1 hypothetical protein [Verrucomicrobiota bacterium]NDE99665.1 hypothetical protein [Verrucomicrobiota bacterium]